MKRDIFRRGPRFTHRFGEAEARDDPFGDSTFDMDKPMFPQRRSSPIEVQNFGERNNFFNHAAPSAVKKAKGGFASLEGPAPNLPAEIGGQVPASTKKRRFPC